jgi:peptidyl-prolyl cis-trans isomerase A (cyclophilin A)
MKSLIARSALVVLVGATQATAMAATPSLPKVVMQTSLGKIVVQVDDQAAPKTGAQFLKLVSKGSYNGGLFYRSTDSTKGAKTHLIQGGSSPSAAIAPTIPLETTKETGLSNTRGTIAMARTNRPNSARAQFFINTGKNTALDDGGTYGTTGGYAVFGRVLRGMRIVEQIEKQPVSGETLERPVSILSATLVTPKGAAAKSKAK